MVLDRVIKYNFQRGWKKRGTSGPGLMKKDELAKFTERQADKEKRSTEENYRDNIERRSREKWVARSFIFFWTWGKTFLKLLVRYLVWWIPAVTIFFVDYDAKVRFW